MADLIEPMSRLERVASGFGFTEGPVWMPDQSLLFSDMPHDKRRRWREYEGVTIERAESHKCNGMTIDNGGALIVCEHSTSRVVREAADGSRTVLAERWKGRELNSPNDVIVASDGAVLFTDPVYGRMPVFGVERDLELEFRGVYRVTRAGELQLLAADFGQPNGLCLSPDESRLYVGDTERAHIRSFQYDANGALSDDRVFASGISAVSDNSDGFVDGMKVDELGNLYVTGPEGIWIFDPGGNRIGTIEVPEKVSNLNWGDSDWRTLYITASTSVYRVRTKVRGNQLGYMRAGRSQ